MNKNNKKDKAAKFAIYVTGILLAALTILAVIDRLPAFWENVTGTYELLPQQNITDSGVPVLVNSKNRFVDEPQDLVCVFDNKTGSYFVKDKTVMLNRQAVLALNEMLDDFYAHTGLKTVNVISGYRSVSAQEEIYRKNILLKGKAYSDRYVQKPGFSEHHTGLAIDLSIFHSENGTSEDFDGAGDYRWIIENAHQYGFIVRYPQNKSDITGIGYEPWHLRYVGIKHANYMAKHDLCLEEYLSALDKRDL